MVYQPDNIVQNDGNNNLQIPNETHYSKVERATEPCSIQNDRVSLEPDVYRELEREQFLNKSEWENYYQRISQPNSRTGHMNSYSNFRESTFESASCEISRRDYQIIPSRDNTLPQSEQHIEYADKAEIAFENYSESSSSSVDVTSNSPGETFGKNGKSNKIISSLSNGNTSDSITSCFNEMDEKEPDNVENSDKSKPYKCNDCGKGFSQMRNYKYHR